MIYDYKSKSTVQDVILDSIEKLTSDIEDEFSSLRRYQYLIIYSPAFLAREIIQAQKGYVKVKSEIGKGSIFSVFLPV